MSLRTKAILMICVVFAAALAITFVVSQTLLMKRFAALERENTNQNTERAVSALYKDFDSMNITFGPTAFDSGSFAWVQDENGMHMEINHGRTILCRHGHQLHCLYHAPGLPPVGVGYDLQTGQPIPLPCWIC